MQILEVRIRKTPDPQECKRVPLRQVPIIPRFHWRQVSLYYKKELRFCNMDDLQCVLTVALFFFQDCGLW